MTNEAPPVPGHSARPGAEQAPRRRRRLPRPLVRKTYPRKREQVVEATAGEPAGNHVSAGKR